MVPIPPIPPVIPKGLDDLVRSEFEAFRGGWFNWLLIWTAVVAVGLLFELPEIWRDTIDVIRALLDKPKGPEIAPWMKLLVSVGWLLIVVGVSGEFVADSFVSKADGIVQTFDEILIADAQRQTEFAKIRAGGAYERAAKNEKEAAQLRKDAEKERTDRQEVETALSPRTLSLEQQRGIVQYLKKFSGHPQVSVGSYGMDGEGMALGGQIIRVIEAATGTAPSDARASMVVSGGFEYGISIRGPDSERPFMDALGKALTAIGKLEQVSVNGLAPPVGAAIVGRAGLIGNAGIVGRGGAPRKVPIPSNGPVQIWVGIKPPPLLPVTSKQK